MCWCLYDKIRGPSKPGIWIGVVGNLELTISPVRFINPLQHPEQRPLCSFTLQCESHVPHPNIFRVSLFFNQFRVMAPLLNRGYHIKTTTLNYASVVMHVQHFLPKESETSRSSFSPLSSPHAARIEGTSSEIDSHNSAFPSNINHNKNNKHKRNWKYPATTDIIH